MGAGFAANLWPGGVVPYEFADLTEPQRQMTLDAMAEWEAVDRRC